MSSTRAETRPGTSVEFGHDLLVHDSVEELAAVAVPFLRAGLERGETALIVTRPPSAAVLRLDGREVAGRPLGCVGHAPDAAMPGCHSVGT